MEGAAGGPPSPMAEQYRIGCIWAGSWRANVAAGGDTLRAWNFC